MYAFTYERPTSLDDALKVLQSGGQALAGGQTMLAAMKQRLMQPEKLIDLASITDLRGIKKEGQHIVIGAMTSHQDVSFNKDVIQSIPSLAHLASGIGDRQVRARGTLGGSVANNDPAACYPSAVLALNATIQTNQRTIAADAFFKGMYATALNEGELITSIRFPIPKRAAYAKFRQPASRFALVGVFVADTGTGVRVAITGAGNGVFRHAGLEAALTKNFSPKATEGITISSADLNSDIHASAVYRAHLIQIQTQRAVTQALG